MSNEKLMELYRQMLVLRHFDEMCYELKMKDLVMNGFHPYSGQDAVAAGVSCPLNHDDVVISNHRPHAHSLCKGSSTRSIFCDVDARSKSCECSECYESQRFNYASAQYDYLG